MLTRLIGEDIDLVMVPGAALGAIKADPGQIEQVIMNLAVNARDAMPHGGKLTIETAKSRSMSSTPGVHVPLQPGEYVMLAISDTGVGMDTDNPDPHLRAVLYHQGPERNRARAFDRLRHHQAERGYVWVYSEPGRGTAFKIYLPRVNAISEVHRSGSGRGWRQSRARQRDDSHR